jgi:hypothetical protein
MVYGCMVLGDINAEILRSQIKDNEERAICAEAVGKAKAAPRGLGRLTSAALFVEKPVLNLQ